jgi:polysaccharide deacetylase family protein (PEP-CTERM system associated)
MNENHLNRQKKILLTFDVEDWFQVENFKEYIPFSSWETKELRVGSNTLQILDLLDLAASDIRATFFVLGWIAERCPELVREIHNRGHEVASHGYNHHLCYNQSEDELREDLIKSKELLEKITGDEIVGYRAPSFSITDKALEIVRKTGFLYDSSYNSYEGHGRYGLLESIKSRERNQPFYSLSPSFYEIPVSNLTFGKKVIPWGGGGYFRLIPSLLYVAGMRKVLKNTSSFVFYLHPWEIDPGQPRVEQAKLFFRFRHYANLRSTLGKLKFFISANRKCSFLTCREFVAMD